MQEVVEETPINHPIEFYEVKEDFEED